MFAPLRCLVRESLSENKFSLSLILLVAGVRVDLGLRSAADVTESATTAAPSRIGSGPEIDMFPAQRREMLQELRLDQFSLDGLVRFERLGQLDPIPRQSPEEPGPIAWEEAQAVLDAGAGVDNKKTMPHKEATSSKPARLP